MSRYLRSLVSGTACFVFSVLASGCASQAMKAAPTTGQLSYEGAYVVLQGEPRLQFSDDAPKGAIHDVGEDGTVLRSEEAGLASLDLVSWSSGSLAVGNTRGVETWRILPSGEFSSSLKGAGVASALARLADGTLVRVANIGNKDRGYLSQLQLIATSGQVSRTLELPGNMVSAVPSGRSLVLAGDGVDMRGQMMVVDLDSWSIVANRTYHDTMQLSRCRSGGDAHTVLCVEHHNDNHPTVHQEGTNRYIVSVRIDSLERTQLAVSDYEVHSIFRDEGKTYALTTEGVGTVGDGKVKVELRVGDTDRQVQRLVRNGKIADILVTPALRDKSGGETVDLGDVFRVDLHQMKVLRRTPLRLPNQPSATPLVIPREYFEGARLDN